QGDPILLVWFAGDTPHRHRVLCLTHDFLNVHRWAPPSTSAVGGEGTERGGSGARFPPRATGGAVASAAVAAPVSGWASETETETETKTETETEAAMAQRRARTPATDAELVRRPRQRVPPLKAWWPAQR